jgi:tRNA(Ile2) C34 agmatinyltransferase TiaS
MPCISRIDLKLCFSEGKGSHDAIPREGLKPSFVEHGVEVMVDVCKECGVKARVHYAAGFDVWTCPKCGARADSRNFYDFFKEVDDEEENEV